MMVQTVHMLEDVEVLGLVTALDKTLYSDETINRQIATLSNMLSHEAERLGGTYVIGVQFIPHVSDGQKNLMRAVGTAVRRKKLKSHKEYGSTNTDALGAVK